jgi:imidazolonepropionase-like amidohydrolase
LLFRHRKSMKDLIRLSLTLLISHSLQGQRLSHYAIVADRVFDGTSMHTGWVVVVEGDKILAVGPKEKITVPKDAISIQYSNSTLAPGLIEGHSHLFLCPYNMTEWDQQVLKESDAYRTARATVSARNTLMAGFTTTRDLGTEGAGFSDVGLKRAINEGIIPGPRMLVAGRAIVATGSYGPKGYDNDMTVMLGAEQGDGNDLIRVVRDQIGKGADVVKVYADYAWGPDKEARPTFSLDELKLIVQTASSSGRPTVAHASTREGMQRAILAGVETIEHGDDLDLETAKMMTDHNVTFIPTLAASESVTKYKGWVKGKSPEPTRIAKKRKSFQQALQAGVTIGMGGDVGVFPHGENVLEMELMVEYGMKPLDVLRSATSINAKSFHLDAVTGSLNTGLQADLVIVSGNPENSISDMRTVLFVMKDGIVYRK